MATIIDILIGSLEQKKQYRECKARMDALPEPHKTAATALHRYLIYYSGVTDGETSVLMMGDLVELWERAAADGKSLREIVGGEPVEFAETFAQSYAGAHWIDKERSRLTTAFTEADRDAALGGQP